ncbi:DUF1345 domain-containing protein [Cellulomonas alba]|uniref:DUF1345 domain-containing protein n=1 Tax=Cellulomonas alba TaxID=3053467 RepID=A0ABT7SEK6_9CELL|nr:DUF1345 domain-containing protein [Cellulomonas alba]MDM7854619.1 DUF1345 domain-containing protein [Cellulomonas alba]
MARRERLHPLDVSPLARLIVSLVVGALVGVVVATLVPTESGVGAVLTGWAATCIVFVLAVWLAVAPMGPEDTQTHATREEPTRRGASLVVLVGSLGSLAGVIALLSGTGGRKALEVVAVIVSVIGSWAAVHTIFALRYARLYYSDAVGGIDFHQDGNPQYTDFAYVAMTVGATFAIADTDLESSVMRRTALWHSLLSFGLGTVVIGLTVNIVAGLSQ